MEESIKNNENFLGTEKISKLLVKFSVPGVISMLVNAIYNVVDQIFIGQGVGYLGNGATSVAFPFVILILAVSLMVSAGCAANVSLNLGRQHRAEAEKVIGNAFVLGALVSLVILVIGEVFNTPLLKLFGATEGILPYAVDYSTIYIIGAPFTALGIIMNDLIRADGNPRYSMITMLSGCISNIVLDYIFIFNFGWGVKGAAFATIIGQIITFILGILYIPRLKNVSFHMKNLKLEASVIGKICGLGTSAAINQLTMLLVQIVLNRSIIQYGSQSIYGADIPITVFGIVMKVNSIMVSVVLGICTATQPIFGYNYGANKIKRVVELFKKTAIVTTIIGIIGMLGLQLFPEQIIAIFGQENELYNEFAVLSFHRMTFFIFVMGFQILSSTYFQSVGKPKNAIILSLSRQFLFLLPAIIILPIIWGIDGIMFAYPVSDVLSVALAIILFIRETKVLKKMLANSND